MSNVTYGRGRYGRNIYAGHQGKINSGYNKDKLIYFDNIYSVIAYNKNGTKSAIFGNGSESNSIEKMNFEITETGCGKLDITFRRLPRNTELQYHQRVDVHLFNDPEPWYSGYIITRPVTGTTEESFKFTAHGYYNLLDKIIIVKTYENMEVSKIVQDIAKTVELRVGIPYRDTKIQSAHYVISKIEFDHVSAKECLKQLADFATDYAYGVDEHRNIYFMPRVATINEQARFWVGEHISGYVPTWNIEKIINHAYIKGGNVDENGEQWLAEVADEESQKIYGIQEKVLDLPSAYSERDAKRWGQNQIEKYKEPVKSAKVSNIKLEYPLANGQFFIRKLSTQGRAAITALDGERYDYSISKLKYTVSAKDGIKCDMELGEQPFSIDKYLFNIEREAKVAELMQQAATRQLK